MEIGIKILKTTGTFFENSLTGITDVLTSISISRMDSKIALLRPVRKKVTVKLLSFLLTD